jgi:hypothetical protein
VVCGDLNLLPVSDTFEMLAQIGLMDLVGESDTRTSRYRKPHDTRATFWCPTQVRSPGSRSSPNRKCPTIAHSCWTSSQTLHNSVINRKDVATLSMKHDRPDGCAVPVVRRANARRQEKRVTATDQSLCALATA